MNIGKRSPDITSPKTVQSIVRCGEWYENQARPLSLEMNVVSEVVGVASPLEILCQR